MSFWLIFLCVNVCNMTLLDNIEHYELCYEINACDKMLNCEILAVWQLNA